MLFRSPNTDDYWDFARKTFRIFLSLVSFTCIVKMSAIFFQAAGRPIFAVVTSLTRDILCFVPLICILPLFYGVEGVLIAAPVADAIAMALNIVFTAVFFRKLLRREFDRLCDNFLGCVSGFAMAYFLWYILMMLVQLLLMALGTEIPTNPNDATVDALTQAERGPAMVMAVFMAPVLEELLPLWLGWVV